MSGAATRRISADGSDEVDISLVGDFAPWDAEAIIDAGERCLKTCPALVCPALQPQGCMQVIYFLPELDCLTASCTLRNQGVF